MKCRDYIFELSSGQLSEASGLRRWAARLHAWQCVSCRRFTRNDRALDRILHHYRDVLQRQDETAADECPASSEDDSSNRR
jgi:hypothetical protein